MANKVKSLRTRLGLSQKRLADCAGTSRYQIQRIEAGGLAKLDLATKISDMLGKSLDEVFPGSAKAIAKVVKEMHESSLLPGKKELDQVRLTGVEFDSKGHTFKAQLRGHDEPLIFPISSAEHDRLFSLVQGEICHDNQSMSFVVFDSEGFRIAINLADLVYCHFLFDSQPPGSITDADPSYDPMEEGVTVYLHGSQRPLDFDVESDVGDPKDEDDAGYFRSILFSIELSPSPSDRYFFVDSNGESVFLRAGDISLIKVPLWVVEPTECYLEEDVLDLPDSESVH